MPLGTLVLMTSSHAVANLHVHLEYDSELDVIAAAMSQVPEGGAAGDKSREHVSQSITSALAHLLDIEAMAPEGSPVRVIDATVEVTVDESSPASDLDEHGSTDEEIAELAAEAHATFDALGLTDDDLALIAQGVTVTATAGPPPFELSPDLTGAPRLISEWGIVCGYLARACSLAIDRLFDDLVAVESKSAIAPDRSLRDWLPPKWTSAYTPLFHRRFIVTMVDVTTKVVRGWDAPATVAQALAMAYLVDTVNLLAQLDEVTLRADLLTVLRDRLVDTDLIEAVYEGSDPELAADEWFVAFFDELPASLYATD